MTYSAKLVQEEMARIISIENAVNMSMTAVNDFIQSTNRTLSFLAVIVRSIDELSKSLKCFFLQGSVYRPVVDQVYEVLQEIKKSFVANLYSNNGFSEAKTVLVCTIDECKFKSKDFNQKNERAHHYSLKVEGLLEEKKEKEKSGKCLSSKELQRLNRVIRIKVELRQAVEFSQRSCGMPAGIVQRNVSG